MGGFQIFIGIAFVFINRASQEEHYWYRLVYKNTKPRDYIKLIVNFVFSPSLFAFYVAGFLTFYLCSKEVLIASYHDDEGGIMISPGVAFRNGGIYHNGFKGKRYVVHTSSRRREGEIIRYGDKEFKIIEGRIELHDASFTRFVLID